MLLCSRRECQDFLEVLQPLKAEKPLHVLPLDWLRRVVRVCLDVCHGMARWRIWEGGRINNTNTVESFDSPGLTLYKSAERDSTKLKGLLGLLRI